MIQALSTNPLFTPSALPYQAPPFDRIETSHFLPAFEEGMRQQLVEVDRIANEATAPTFENTLVALERTGEMLTRVQLAFNALSGANTNEELQRLQELIAPKLAAHRDAILLNPKLFSRVEAVHTQRDEFPLDQESRRLIDFHHQQFVMAGARLSDAEKSALTRLNEEEAALEARFTNQLLDGTKSAALVVDDKSELAGLSDAEIASAAELAKARGLDGRWVLALKNTTQQPLLRSLTNRKTRERLFKASWMRTEHAGPDDTRATFTRLAATRAARAALLGVPSFSAWRLQDQMATDPARVQTFLQSLTPAAVAKARGEAADIQSIIDRQDGGFTLAPWDWDFYAEQIRKTKYDLDESQIKPYFELTHVLVDGVFFAAQMLYGLTFRERDDLPVYHPDVRVFEVFDRDGSHLALLYCDFFKRDNKNGGAWMDVFVRQSTLLGTQPIIANVASFPKPAAGQPALLSFDEVTTLFHEFGHGLHGLLADQQYPSLSGTSVARDFVELPSQFNEHWALDPAVLAHYAKHHETGAPMPDALAENIRKAATFNQGYALTEVLAAAHLDMGWHTLPPDAAVADPERFEIDTLARANIDPTLVPPRYRSSYFLHIWAHGYAAGYYAYLWAEMLDEDTFGWFEEHGGLTRENGQRFRDLILSRGNTDDYAKMYRDFRGRDPIIQPMLKRRGLA